MDDEQFNKCQSYQKERFVLHVKRLTVTYFVRIGIWVVNMPALFWMWTQPWVQKNVQVSKHIKRVQNWDHLVQDFVQGLLLIFVIYWIDIIIGLSFSAYKQFVIEERAGFNKYTKCRWCTQVFKIVGTPFLTYPFGIAFVMILMYCLKDYFSLFAFGMVCCSLIVSLIVMKCCKQTRKITEYLMNKGDLEMEKNSLRQNIQELASTVKYPTNSIIVDQQSLKSDHSNASMSGEGVMLLTDTLLLQNLGLKEDARAATGAGIQESLLPRPKRRGPYNQNEFDYDNKKGKLDILSIVAHELGHWYHNDNSKKIYMYGFYALVCLGSLELVILYTDMLPSFGFQPFLVFRSHFLRLYLFYRMGDFVMYIQKFIDYAYTRTIEYRADRYSVGLGYANSLKEAICKIFLNNMGNLNPDKYYSMMKFSHPAFNERLDAIDDEVKKMTKKEDLKEAYKEYRNMFKSEFIKRHGKEMFEIEMVIVEDI